MSTQETIYALATAPGKSGVAVLRLSGTQALSVLIELTGKSDWKPNIVRYCSFSRATSHEPRATIDRGLALYFKAPHSFTGEDVAELQLHGSPAVIREMLAVLGGFAGLRHAEPGEFTRRAFLNGKMDLIEAEGLADLIEAETPAQREQAMRQMAGEVSGLYDDLRTRILRPLALLEAYIDFPEEDIPESVLAEVAENINKLQMDISNSLEDGGRGERLRDGITVAILGAPNAGKSSLINMLAKRDVAIVSAQAGTTRDVIEVHMDIAGFPVVLLDTAGLRESADSIEQEGIRRALKRAEEADIKLVLFDAASEPDAQSLQLIDKQSIIVLTKADLLQNPEISVALPFNTGIKISTISGQGVANLLKKLEEMVISRFSSQQAPLITRARHRSLLSASLLHLQRFDTKMPLEIACEELRQASVNIGKITGKIAVDELLDVIFRQFCIGK